MCIFNFHNSSGTGKVSNPQGTHNNNIIIIYNRRFNLHDSTPKATGQEPNEKRETRNEQLISNIHSLPSSCFLINTIFVTTKNYR